MSEITATMGARRRLKRISDIRSLFTYSLGAALGFAVLGFVQLFTGQEDVFPSIIVAILVIVGVVGERLTQRRYADALDDVELAARNTVRAEG